MVRPASSGSSSLQLAFSNSQIDAPLLHGQPNAVAPGPARARRPPPLPATTCSTIVPYAVPLMRASEIRTMSFTPARAGLRDRQVARFRHGVSGLGPAFCSTRKSSAVTSSGIVDALGKIIERAEHDRAAFFLEELRIGRRALEDRAVRRERAEERDQPALRGERVLQFTHNCCDRPRAYGARSPLQRDAGDRHAVEVKQRLELAQHRADAARGVQSDM